MASYIRGVLTTRGGGGHSLAGMLRDSSLPNGSPELHCFTCSAFVASVVLVSGYRFHESGEDTLHVLCFS